MDGKEVRPGLLGWGLGFGVGPEASSAVYLDFCATVSPYSALARAKPYIGVSFDGVVALKLFQAFVRRWGWAKSRRRTKAMPGGVSSGQERADVFAETGLHLDREAALARDVEKVPAG